MDAPVLDPRAATAAAIARSLVFDGAPPRPGDVRDLAVSRFHLTLSDAQIRAAIETAVS